MPSNNEDLKSIQADVASFVSSLGFGDGTGFNDTDFRKKGSISAKKPNIALHNTKDSENPDPKRTEKPSPFAEHKKTDRTRKLSEHQSKKPEQELKSNEKSKEHSSKQAKNTSSLPQKLSDSAPDQKQKAERARVYDSAVSVTKQKSEHTSVSNSDAYKKKQKAEKIRRKAGESRVSVSAGTEQYQKPEKTRDTAKDGSKIISKVWSLLKSGPWFEATAALLATGESNGALGIKDKQNSKNGNGEEWSVLVAKARKKGDDLMEKASAEYEKSRGKDSDMRWLMIARKTGTTADKVAAFTVLLQDNPVANLKSLDALLGMVTSKGGKRHAAMGIDALKELFVASLLPDRKLKFLTQQPLQAHPDIYEAERLLFLWYWEDCLKHRYEQFVCLLEEATKDKLPFLKEKAVKTIYELLKSKPEQERKLLSALVNKLGDPERKVASNAGYYLSCLLTAHPNMKMVVVEEVDSFLFRPHLGLRSRYQAVVFLNQIVLSNRGDGPKLAIRLIDIYFSLFKVITAGESRNFQQKDRSKGSREKSLHKQEAEDDAVVEIDSRLLSALLTGVNRAFPYVAANDVDTLIEEHTPVLFRLVHSKSFNVGVQALMLLYQLLAKNNTVSDRLYRALYAVLLSPGLSKSTKVEMFLGLVFKAIKSDINSKRMAAFSKRLMQVALQGAPQFACGCLLLLSEVLKSRPTLWHAVTQPEDGDEEIEHFEDCAEEDTTKDDIILSNQQVLGANHTAGNSAATKELTVEPEYSSESDELNCMVSDLDDDDESISADEEEMNAKGKVTERIQKDSLSVLLPGTTQARPTLDSLTRRVQWPKEGHYSSRHRDPSFCNADQACWWELTALASHVHPSVAAMAKTLLSGASILYAGDPLRDLALNVFLDRFTEKKPKSRRKSETWHGSSLSAPAKKALTSTTMLPVGVEFLQLSEREVAPEDVVFHKFYTSKLNRKGKSNKEAKIKEDAILINGEEDDLVGDNSSDDEIDDLLDQDEGAEMGLDDLSEEENESEGEWTFKQTDGAFEDVNGEYNSSEEDLAFEDMNGEHNSSEENGIFEDMNREHTFEEDIDKGDNSQDTSHRDVKKRTKKQSNLKKQAKKGREKRAFTREGSKKSPFASIDYYSHILDDERLDKDKGNFVSNVRKRKRTK